MSLEVRMADSKRLAGRVRTNDSLSTKAAQEVLASQTRAFGNQAAKQNLQSLTAAFAVAKQKLDAAEAIRITPQEQE
jgi:hypothetical protein